MPDRKTFLFFNCLLDGMHTIYKGFRRSEYTPSQIRCILFVSDQLHCPGKIHSPLREEDYPTG